MDTKIDTAKSKQHVLPIQWEPSGMMSFMLYFQRISLCMLLDTYSILVTKHSTITWFYGLHQLSLYYELWSC